MKSKTKALVIAVVMWRERQAVRMERTVGRSVGDRPQAGGIAQRGFVGFKGRPDCGSANGT